MGKGNWSDPGGFVFVQGRTKYTSSPPSLYMRSSSNIWLYNWQPPLQVPLPPPHTLREIHGHSWASSLGVQKRVNGFKQARSVTVEKMEISWCWKLSGEVTESPQLALIQVKWRLDSPPLPCQTASQNPNPRVHWYSPLYPGYTCLCGLPFLPLTILD